MQADDFRALPQSEILRTETAADASSLPFEIVETTRTGASFAFRFNSVPGRIYV